MTTDHQHGSDSPATRTEALEALLVKKGLVQSAAVDALVERYEQDIGPLRGARVVAEAWTDPAFRARLLEDGMPAIRELGFGDNTDAHVARLVVKENTEIDRLTGQLAARPHGHDPSHGHDHHHEHPTENDE